MVELLLKNKVDVFWKHEENDPILGSEISSYLSLIDALMYLINQTILDISFAISLRAQYSAC